MIYYLNHTFALAPKQIISHVKIVNFSGLDGRDGVPGEPGLDGVPGTKK